MRTHVFGASPLRRPAGRLAAVIILGAGLALTSGSSAFAQVPSTSGSHGSGWDHGRVSLWERDDRAWVDGVEYAWPEDHTWTYDGKVCPDGDVVKTDTEGSPETVEIVAPEGKVIDSYCVKSGQEPSGGGARIVEVDEPVEQLTIAYPRNGKASGISHYSVCFRDVKPGEEVPEETGPPTLVTEDEQPPVTTEPVPVEPPAAVPPATETVTETATPDEVPTDEPEAVTVVVTEAGTPSPSATPVATLAEPAGGTPSPSPEAGRLAATDDGAQATARVRETGELALTGAEVTGIFVAAVVLIALGTLAIHTSRRRTNDTP